MGSYDVDDSQWVAPSSGVEDQQIDFDFSKVIAGIVSRLKKRDVHGRREYLTFLFVFPEFADYVGRFFTQYDFNEAMDTAIDTPMPMDNSTAELNEDRYDILRCVSMA